jgi:CO dehydrogenase/acetyl-CoA synthase epsilon subunit
VIPAKEFEGELWIKASDHHQAIKAALAQPAQETVARVLQIIKELRPAIKPLEVMGKGKTTDEWFDILVKEIEQALKEKNT